MEIYNEEVRDLLGKDLNKSLEVKERADIGVFVKDLNGYDVHNADDLDNIMKLGNKKSCCRSDKDEFRIISFSCHFPDNSRIE